MGGGAYFVSEEKRGGEGRGRVSRGTKRRCRWKPERVAGVAAGADGDGEDPGERGCQGRGDWATEGWDWGSGWREREG